jgi:hypothetical protein
VDEFVPPGAAVDFHRLQVGAGDVLQSRQEDDDDVPRPHTVRAMIAGVAVASFPSHCTFGMPENSGDS